MQARDAKSRHRITCAGRKFACFAVLLRGSRLFAFDCGISPQGPQRTGNKYGGVETDHNTDDDRQGERLDRRNAQDINHTDGQQGGHGRIDRPGHGLPNAGICNLSVGLFSRVTGVLSDSVHDNDGVIDGITQNRQNRRNKVGIHAPLQEGIYAQQQQYVVYQGHNRNHTGR